MCFHGVRNYTNHIALVIQRGLRVVSRQLELKTEGGRQDDTRASGGCSLLIVEPSARTAPGLGPVGQPLWGTWPYTTAMDKTPPGLLLPEPHGPAQTLGCAFLLAAVLATMTFS